MGIALFECLFLKKCTYVLYHIYTHLMDLGGIYRQRIKVLECRIKIASVQSRARERKYMKLLLDREQDMTFQSMQKIYA